MSNDETLKQWAHKLLEENADTGAVVEDPVSICSYVSRTRGVELTIEEGEKVREHLLALQQHSRGAILKHSAELKSAGGLSHRECATVLAALRNWQLTLTNLGLSDRSSKDVAKALAKDIPTFDHFEDGTKPLTVKQIDALCERINLSPTARIASINLDPGKPVSTTDSAILDQIDDLLANEFGEDERPEVMPDACYELLRHIADDLLDTRKRPEEIAEACECLVTRQKHGTVCRRCWQEKMKLYIERRGVACPF